MKKILLLLAAAALTLTLVSCDEENGDPTDPEGTIPVNLTTSSSSHRIDMSVAGKYQPDYLNLN